MAVPKTARIVGARPVGEWTRAIDLELEGGGPLGFRGGQYLIVDTGVDLEGGKRAKRAYSLLSSDEEQGRFTIAVKRLEPGPGSSAMHAKDVGATFTFSGPWGKLLPAAEPRGATIVFCTDTGITAGLGLARSGAFRAMAPGAVVVWYAETGAFLAEDFVRDALAERGIPLVVEPALAVHHPERADHARDALNRAAGLLDAPPADAFLTGDGHVIYPLQEELVAAGLASDRVLLEPFFHNPARKAP
jgi:ferredoxin-NADP reductase